MKPRYHYERISGAEGINYRITDSTTDSRVATCFNEGNARLMVDALNSAQAGPLTFERLRLANMMRLPLFRDRQGRLSHSQPDGSDWTIAEWTNAMAGEVGEACNLAKKIRRGDFGEPGSDTYADAMTELALELADVVTYADIACMQTGMDLGNTVAIKFNIVSERVGCEVKL